ncbi:MAG: hypothetical protein CVU71_12195 [Deltaproteobacteria bacterium HGW-Deltaproteobacteria-6]|nr:MAG: hypothetical protein CVU71_12195 [Deltaproteobacteria bacterium HGW-Deltaproteobacteria-6]
MTKKFFSKSGVLFIMSLFMVFALFACVQRDHKAGGFVGGPCQYKSYPGQATILSITDSQAGAPDQIKRFDVKFSFTPQEKIEESFGRAEGKTFNLYGNNWQYPDQEFLRVHNIQVGKVLDGNLRAIPVLFDFPALKQKQ